jgi:E3 ubiquitin-protein ligase HUWE1
MSPILIGSKNKDTYVEHYVGILCRKNKLNPYTSLWKELDLISQNYMVIGDQKIIDIGKLVDYDALSVHMSDKYFFRKIIKHISP